MKLARRITVATLLLLGAGLGAHAAWIPAKASLAQLLLLRAWERARGGEPRPRPWPWADTWPVARLEAPGLGIRQVVLAGISGRSLAFGPGHMDGTAEPGRRGNCVLAGHRDTVFAFLRELSRGDRLILEDASGRRVAYRVEEARVVDAGDTWVAGETDARVLTLVTCWPFDAVVPGGPGRYVVRAEAVEEGSTP